MTFTVAAYLGYLVLSVGLTIWVARTLAKNGRVFLVDAFGGNAELADSVNKLLVVGFYLINVGYGIAVSPTGAIAVGGQSGERDGGPSVGVTGGAVQNYFAGGQSDGFVLLLGQ